MAYALSVLTSALCPVCRAALDAALKCPTCEVSYPQLGGIRVLLVEPDRHLVRWRQQLGRLLWQASQSITSLADHMGEAHLRDPTRRRLRALAGAIAEQADDLVRALQPSIGEPLPPEASVALPRGAGDYLPYLFRDWGWSNGQDEENRRSLAVIREVTGAKSLGRVLVLGAGGCRLAYDLHLHGDATETVALDIDPVLLVIAEAVIRGGQVSLTECSVNAPETEPVSHRWILSAPDGPLASESFHVVLADGTNPPFADGSFDTVVTPWFIDQVPTDLDAFIGRLRTLLRPGGRWINHGPLIYRPDALPVTQWLTREEIFDLAGSVGFRVGAWQTLSQPCTLSPLTGRGLIENVLTFEAALPT